MTTTSKDISELAINTIRTLSMDGVEAAGCGHPGTPMALAPVTYQLWSDVLRYDPTAPLWPNRDRYVLSLRPRFDADLLDDPSSRYPQDG